MTGIRDRLLRLERRVAAAHVRAFGPPQEIVRIARADGLRELRAVDEMQGWPLTRAATWHRGDDEDEPAFIARLFAGADPFAVLLERDPARYGPASHSASC